MQQKSVTTILYVYNPGFYYTQKVNSDAVKLHFEKKLMFFQNTLWYCHWIIIVIRARCAESFDSASTFTIGVYDNNRKEGGHGKILCQ